MTAEEYLKKYLGTNFSPDTPFRYKNVLVLMEQYHQEKLKKIKKDMEYAYGQHQEVSMKYFLGQIIEKLK